MGLVLVNYIILVNLVFFYINLILINFKEKVIYEDIFSVPII